MILAQLPDLQLQLLLYAKVTKYMLYGPCDVWEDVKDVRSRSGVTQSGAELLWSGRELTTKWRNNFGLSSCAVPQSAVAHVVVYFRRTELLSGVQERSGI